MSLALIQHIKNGSNHTALTILADILFFLSKVKNERKPAMVIYRVVSTVRKLRQEDGSLMAKNLRPAYAK